MRFFLDTANIGEITEGVPWGCFSGVTVNPVLAQREGNDYRAVADAVLAAVPDDWDVSLQVQHGAPGWMIEQARELAGWDSRVRVKVPMTINGLMAARELAGAIKLNMTVGKNAAQGLMAATLLRKRGARLRDYKTPRMFVSVFCGRLRQAGHNWRRIVEACQYERAWILAASIKTPADIEDVVSAGADIVTAPLEVYRMALDNPLVQEDVDAFNAAFDRGLTMPIDKEIT